MKTPSEFPSKSGMGGWFHYDKALVSFRPPVIKYTEPVLSKIASEEKRDKVYRQLLSNCQLSQEHKDLLISKGIKDFSLYKTLDLVNNDWNGMNPEGVPGFYLKGDQWKISMTKGLLIPMISSKGLITGIQLRTEDKGRKYIWFSSSNRPNGTKAEMVCHVVKPSKIRDKRIFITEGVFKAEIAAQKLGAVFIAVAGVYSTDKAIKELRALDPESVVIAYDMDMKTNESVKRANERLIERLDEYDIFQAEWNDQFKGIDDALLAGEGVTINLVKKSRYISLNKARALQFNLFEKIFIDPDLKTHLIQSTTGAGKTTACIDALNRLHHSNTWKRKKKNRIKKLFLVDNYAQALEVQEKLQFKAPVMKGRSEDQSSPFYCSNKSLCDQAGRAGHNVFNSVCKSCPYLDMCNYMETMKDIMSESFVIATKHGFLNNSDRINGFDIIIIDESLHDWLYDCRILSKQDLGNVVLALETYSSKAQKVSEEFGERAIPQIIKNGELAWDHIDQIDDLLMLIENAGSEPEKLDRDWIPDKSPILDRAFELDGGETIYPHQFIGDLSNSVCYISNQGLYIYTPKYDLIDNLKNITVINLDATPIPSLLSVLSPEVHSFEVKQHIEISQVYSVKGSKVQLRNEEYKDKYVKAVNKIADSYSVAAIGTKEFIHNIQGEISERVQVGWYGNDSRATNRYQDSDALIVLGDYCPNISHVRILKDCANLLGQEIEMDKLISEMSSAEKIQAIGRLRACRRSQDNMAKVFVLSNREIEGIKPDNTIYNIETIYGEEYKRDKINHERKLNSVSKVRNYLSFQKRKGADIHSLKIDEIIKATGSSFNTVKRELDLLKMNHIEQFEASFRNGSNPCYNYDTTTKVPNSLGMYSNNINRIDAVNLKNYLPQTRIRQWIERNHNTEFRTVSLKRFLNSAVKFETVEEITKDSRLHIKTVQKYYNAILSMVKSFVAFTDGVLAKIRGEEQEWLSFVCVNDRLVLESLLRANGILDPDEYIWEMLKDSDSQLKIKQLKTEYDSQANLEELRERNRSQT